MNQAIQTIASCPIARLFILCALLDLCMGVLRAVKYKKFNSTFGIDGAIRKCAMIVCICILSLVDMMFGLNLINVIPDSMAGFISNLGIASLGVAEVFGLVFIVCEAISILKNMLLCGVPIPAKMYTKVANVLDEWTDELTDFELVRSYDEKGVEHVIVGERKNKKE